MKNSPLSDRLLAGGFVTSLLIMAVLFLALPKTTFSEAENRVLQGLPELSWSHIWNKQFSQESEAFVTDHFPMRAGWVRLKSELEQLRLQRENNGIYKGKDGHLFEKFEQPDYAKAAAYAEAVRQFAQMHAEANMTFMLAPTSIGIYPERLPWLASAYPQSKVNAFVKDQLQGSLAFLDGFDFLGSAAHNERPVYYRTDHHWTTYGAYLAYTAYARQMGWSPMPESDFNIQTVTDAFLGSYHTRSQFSGVKPDSIEVYLPKKPLHSTMYIADDGTTHEELYNDSFLSKKDKYSYFLGGVHALMTIKTELPLSTNQTDKLLVIKDSYAHSMLPFLTSHVRELHVIDMRYYNGNISEYMKENDIHNVLFLFNTATFLESSELLKLGA
ncbi:DHHW family protein [Paenibacillus kobensis]|uniref:DHHW family protein n=1 Tax=Paenibacillus kobensis TaxID=59841 RepID=UPI000FDC13CE|nr:DHHW family protein [Paenibacillus kobensis]